MKNASLGNALAPLLLFGLAVAAGGCSHDAGGLTLTSLQNHQSYQQNFSNGYASRNDSGDLDIVLVDDAAKRSLAGDKSKAPVRQIMHVRVLWKPTRDMKSNEAAASNASIHWYVIGSPAKSDGGKPVAPAEIVQYVGTAWVNTSTDDDVVTVDIRNAVLKPVVTRGLHDPVGPSKVEGTVTAHFNGQRVNQLLAEVRTTTAPAARPAAYFTPVQ